MTIVGDLAQRESPAGATSWAAMLDTYVPDRWTYRQLTVNYRMPVEIMEVAARVLTEVNPDLRPPRSVRSGDAKPWALRTEPDGLAAAVADIAAKESTQDGSLVVIVPDRMTLDVDATVLTARQSKGLEFDSVVIVEPAAILAAAPSDLYVAMTRATQRLAVLHTGNLPDCLTTLAQ